MRFKSVFVAAFVVLCADRVQAQTNESLIAKYARETYASTTWGRPTNGIQFGAKITAVGTLNNDTFKVFTALYNTTSSNIYGLWRLPSGYRFEDVSLKKKSGEAIPRTRAGNRLCKAPWWDLSDGRIIILESKFPEYFDELFDVRDCFKIQDAGAYTLTIKARLYLITGNRAFTKLDLPEAHVDFVLTNSDLMKGGQ